MTLYCARSTFFLSTADLCLLQPYTPSYWTNKYYKFEDVLGTGMLRFGRRPYVERLLRKPIRKLKAIDKRRNRWSRVQQLHQRCGVLLETEVLEAYAEEYLKSGVGLSIIRSRIFTHKYFCQRVTLNHRLMHSNLSVAEQVRIKQIQKAYVLTNDYDLVLEAIRIVMAMRGMH
jgi:hypothetical protein